MPREKREYQLYRLGRDQTKNGQTRQAKIKAPKLTENG